jgi:YVTN family beta-propeller protein
MGSDPVVCTAEDSCHVEGECDPATGVCSGPPAPDGTRCGDTDVCNGEEVCRAGTCVVPTASEAVACAVAGEIAVVPNFGVNTVDVLVRGTRTTVAVAGGPWGVALDPRGTRAYVSCREAKALAVLDLATATIVTTVPVGGTPLGVAVDPAGSRAYVASYDDNVVHVVDLATNTVVGTLATPQGPAGVAFDGVGARLYVTAYGADRLIAVDVATGVTVASVAVGRQPLGVAFDGRRQRVYVANFADATISVVGAMSHSVLAT